ncbi:hypothetical protein C2845_PM09G11830 [Panicum miliaceum]|uniref:Uncharacterized protein n=1 Tax=Panicum miliaceum TaxID=4540 RepID=A0A3L6RZI9_PANMI|nr:hypothetical protein C2845_PM09G11830 [Panicum miliaceum]
MKVPVTFRTKMPRKTAAGRGKKRGNEGRDESSPPSKRRDCWLDKLSEENSRDIPELMQQIQAPKDKGFTGESVTYLFFERRIQPLQQRVHLGFEYQGIEDPTRMAKDVPSNEEIMHRVTRLFTGVHSEPYISRLFNSNNPPDPADLEWFRSDPPEPVVEEPAEDPAAEESTEDLAANPLRPQRVASCKRRATATVDASTSRQTP